MRYIIGAFILGSMFMYAACIMFQHLVLESPESKKYDSENKCIAMLVARGTERRDIIRDNGSCTTIRSKRSANLGS